VLGLPFFIATIDMVAHYIYIACVFAILVTDSIVSVMLMVIFLRPIMGTLNMAGVVRSNAQANLKKTKWLTMGEYFHAHSFAFFATPTSHQPLTNLSPRQVGRHWRFAAALYYVSGYIFTRDFKFQ
jgi:hypothetical protein